MTDARIENRRRMQGQQTNEPRVSRRPASGVTAAKFGSTKVFQTALIENRSDRSLTGRDRAAKERELVAQRARELGE